MKQLLIILFVCFYLTGFAQQSRVVNWKFVVENTTYVNDSTWTITAVPYDFSDPGAVQREVGNYVKDNVGNTYQVISSTLTTLTVIDLQFNGVPISPQQNQVAACYLSVVNGDPLFGPTANINYFPFNASTLWRITGENDEALALAIDSLNRVMLRNPVDTLLFGKTSRYSITSECALYADSLSKGLVFNTGIGGYKLQIGQHLVQLFYNDTPDTIPRSKLLHLKAAVMPNPQLTPTYEYYDGSDWEKVQGSLGIAIHDVPPDSYGWVGYRGLFDKQNTLGLSQNSQIWGSADGSGDLTNSRPSFPDFGISIGGAAGNSETDGWLLINIISTISNIFDDAWDGSIQQTFDFRTFVEGGIIKGVLTNQGDPTDDLRAYFSDGFYTFPVPDTIDLIQGTATVPQDNYVYISKADKTLQVSSGGFPVDEHAKVAQLSLLNATITASSGALRNQNINDHIKSNDDNGHILHIAQRIRIMPAVWESGTASLLSGTPSNVYIDVSSGSVWQMHLQSFPQQYMSLGADIHVVNDPDNPYRTTINLNDITEYSDGSNWNNRWGNLVIWGVMNKTGEVSHIMCNLPSGGYTQEDDTFNDEANYSNYAIPRQFRGVGFLIGRFTVRKSGTSFTYNESSGYVDLRGTFPNTIAGGGGSGGGGVVSYLQLEDTEATALSLAFQRWSSDATVLENVLAEDIQLTEFDSTGFTLSQYQVEGLVDTIANHDTRIKQNESDISTLQASSHPALTKVGVYDYFTLDESNQIITANQIDLTTDVTGLLPQSQVEGLSDTFNNYVDLFNDQTIAGEKTYLEDLYAKDDLIVGTTDLGQSGNITINSFGTSISEITFGGSQYFGDITHNNGTGETQISGESLILNANKVVSINSNTSITGDLSISVAPSALKDAVRLQELEDSIAAVRGELGAIGLQEVLTVDPISSLALTTNAHTIKSTNNTDELYLHHNNTDASISWNDGVLNLGTIEGTDQQTVINVKGHGNAGAEFRVFNTAGDDYLKIRGTSYIDISTNATRQLDFQYGANASIRMFAASAEGETQELKIYGRRTGDINRLMAIGVGVDEADAASFDGVSKYIFDGAVEVATTMTAEDVVAIGDVFAQEFTASNEVNIRNNTPQLWFRELDQSNDEWLQFMNIGNMYIEPQDVDASLIVRNVANMAAFRLYTATGNGEYMGTVEHASAAGDDNLSATLGDAKALPISTFINDAGYLTSADNVAFTNANNVFSVQQQITTNNNDFSLELLNTNTSGSGLGIVHYGTSAAIRVRDGSANKLMQLDGNGELFFPEISNETGTHTVEFIESTGEFVYAAKVSSSLWTEDTYGITYSDNVGIGGASNQYYDLYVYDDVRFNSTLQVTGGIRDGGGQLGTSGQILSSTGSGLDWIDASGSGTVTSVAISGSDFDITGSPITTAGTITMSIADDAVGIAELSASGTANSTTFLRGDNTWATIAGVSFSGVKAYASVAIDENTGSIFFQSEYWDTDSYHSNTALQNFYAPSNGYYTVTLNMTMQKKSTATPTSYSFFLNTSAGYSKEFRHDGTWTGTQTQDISITDVVYLTTGQYVSFNADFTGWTVTSSAGRRAELSMTKL